MIRSQIVQLIKTFKSSVSDPYLDTDPHGSALILHFLIRIRIGHWEYGSGSASRNKETDQNKQINLISSLSKWLSSLPYLGRVPYVL